MRARGPFVLAAVLAVGVGALAQAATPPDVVFIAVDDLNTWVGHLAGHPDARTPNLDRLARRGVTFTRAYAPAPACNPSRAALLTGRRPSTTGIYHNDQPWGPVVQKLPTLPLHFARHGYEVVGGGKIFHGGGGPEASYFPDGYWKRPGDPHPPAGGGTKMGRGHFDWATLEVDDAQMGDAKLVDWATGVLASKHDRPLFLAVGFVKPHLPWYVPKKHVELFPLDKIRLPVVKNDDLADVPPAGVKMAKPDGDHAAVIKHDEWKRGVQHYLAAIHFMDAQVGRLLDALDRSPRGKNTVVLLFGDHGWHLGEKLHWRKFALWEEATRAPLIVAGPGAKAGARCDRPVDFMSIFPTLVDLAGLPGAAGVEGASLRPLLADPRARWEHAAVTTHGRGNHAVRTDRWRYIRYGDAGGEELYDHLKDELEWRNLANDPATAAARKQLLALLPKTNAADAPKEKPAQRLQRDDREER